MPATAEASSPRSSEAATGPGTATTTSRNRIVRDDDPSASSTATPLGSGETAVTGLAVRTSRCSAIPLAIRSLPPRIALRLGDAEKVMSISAPRADHSVASAKLNDSINGLVMELVNLGPTASSNHRFAVIVSR